MMKKTYALPVTHVIGKMRIEQARLDLSKSNKKLGLVVPKSLDVSATSEEAAGSDNNRAKSKIKKP